MKNERGEKGEEGKMKKVEKQSLAGVELEEHHLVIE
jgi:hypothetical protein